MKYGCVFISIILQIQQSNIFISLLGQRRDGKEAGTDFIIYLSLNVTIPAARIERYVINATVARAAKATPLILPMIINYGLVGADKKGTGSLVE